MEWTLTCTIDLRVAAAVAVALLLFGVLYNEWVAGLEENGHDRGYMGFIVALGCGVTIVGIGVATWSLWIPAVMLAMFAASGTPMIWGSIKRYIDGRSQDTERARQDARQALGDE